jgi:hypothetical protein
MAFLMTDVAAGSTAARNLQQNIYGAQYDEANIAAAAEQNQLKLQQDRIKTMYAPEEAKLKLEQDQLGNEKTRLANLVANTGFKASQESKQKLRELTDTEDFKTADDAGKVRLWAMTEAKVSGDPTKLVSNLQAAEMLDAKAIATKQKQLDQNAQQMGNAFAVVDALKTPEQQIQFFKEMETQQPEQYQNLIKQIGPSTFEKMTTEEKHGALKGLMFNAKGQLATQLKQIEAEKQILINESRERIARIREDGRLNAKLAGGNSDRDMRDWKLYNNAIEGIDRSGRKTLDKLNEDVNAADLAQEKSKINSFFPNAKDPSEATALTYRKAVEARDNFQRSQLKKQIDVTTTAPNFPGKAAILENMNRELELYGPAPKAQKEEKPEATKPAAKAEVPATTPAKPSVPSNKPPAKLTQEQNNAAITKANEAIKNGADPEKVKARLKEAGVSFKE